MYCPVFSQLFSVSVVPSDWKSAVITPVYKKGVAGNVCNYRPISLTCVPSKIMERVIARQMYEHLKAHGKYAVSFKVFVQSTTRFL